MENSHAGRKPRQFYPLSPAGRVLVRGMVSLVARAVHVFGVEFEEPVDLKITMDTLQRLGELAERTASREMKAKHHMNDRSHGLASLRCL
jgi:hypothetical protein